MGSFLRDGNDLSPSARFRLLVVMGMLHGIGVAAATAQASRSPALDESLRAELGQMPRQAAAGRYHLTAGPAGAIDQQRAERLVEALARFEQAYRALWQGGPPLRESPASVEIFLIVEGGQLRRIMSNAGITRPFFDTGGLYLKESATLIVENSSRLERSILASLVHETTHFLNHEMLQGDAFPPWLQEGLAVFCEYSRYAGPAADAGFELGVIDPGSELRIPQGKDEMIYRFTPARSLSYLQGQMRSDHGLSLGPLLSITDRSRFYGKGAQLSYAQSWTLVHLLAQGTARPVGALRAHFLRYVALAARGEASGEKTLPKFLGLSIEDLDEAWRRHIKKLW